MHDEPFENPSDRVIDPAVRARDKADEFRMHAELVAVFEGPRKFDAQLYFNLDDSVARDIQRQIGKLDKAKKPGVPLIPPDAADQARSLLQLADEQGMPVGDYHIRRRPGELMIVRWLSGSLVDTFYARLQAHLDAALEGCREDERQAHGWKQDHATQAYLAALDQVKIDMAERYLRSIIRQHKVFVLSTLTVDELNIQYLAEDVMGISTADLVGPTAAPPESYDDTSDPEYDPDRAWYFRLFSLRGLVDDAERMCFFAYLQKTQD